MSDNASSRLSRAAGRAKPAVVGVIVFVAVRAAVATGTAGEATPGDVTTVGEASHSVAGQTRLDTLVARHDCSHTGLGADEIPASSLVLQGGKVRHVSFDHGWAVYTGERDGTLLAVCRAAV